MYGRVLYSLKRVGGKERHVQDAGSHQKGAAQRVLEGQSIKKTEGSPSALELAS